MIVKNLLSKIKENFEIYKLEKRIEDIYKKYGETTLEFIKESLKVLKERKKVTKDSYRRILETLLNEDIIKVMDYIWDRYYWRIDMIPPPITYGIINFVRYIEDKNMIWNFIKVLKMYSDIVYPLDKKLPLSELILLRMFHPLYYGTQLKEGDQRILPAIRCTLDELLNEQTKQRAREDGYIIDKIIINCAEKAGFRPDYTITRHITNIFQS